MAPPFLFTLRHRGYQAGCGVLLLATMMAIFGVMSPGWYSVAKAGTQYYTHLWISCSNGLRGCHFLSPSEMKGFQKATQAFALLGLTGLVTSCLVAVYLNFLTENKRHHRFLEVAILVSGGLAFLSGIIFVAGNPDYIDSRTAAASAASAADSTDLEIKGGYAMALTFVGAIVALAAGAVVWIFNRPLEIPSDERSLSDLRRTDPVDRLHREARGGGRGGRRRGRGGDDEEDEDDREFGFTNPALQMADEEPPARPGEGGEGEGHAGRGREDRPPSYRNFEPPRRPPGHPSRPIGPGADSLNGFPPSVEQAAAPGHPAINIDRRNYQQRRPDAPTGWNAGVGNNHPHNSHAHHYLAAANVDHHLTTSTPNNNNITGVHAEHDTNPRLDLHLDPGSQRPGRHGGPGGFPRGEERERGREGRDHEGRRENRHRHPPPRSSRGSRPEADDDSALREIRNNEINAAASAAALRHHRCHQQHQQQRQTQARHARSEGDSGVNAGPGGVRDWQRGQGSRGYHPNEREGGEIQKAADDLHRPPHSDPNSHRPPGRPHPYHEERRSRGQQPRSASLGRTDAARERPLPSSSSSVATRRPGEGSGVGHDTQKDRRQREEEDVYTDGDLGEPTPSYRQAAVKTWVTGGGRDWSRGGGGGRAGETEGERYRGGEDVGSGERRPAAAVSDNRYADDAHIYVNVGPGFGHRHPSPQAPPPVHPHSPHPTPPDYRDSQGSSSSSNSSSDRPRERRQERHERADPSGRNASDPQNAGRGRAYGSDDRNDDRNKYGGSGTVPAWADAGDGQGYVNVIQAGAFEDTGKRYSAEDNAYGERVITPDPDFSRPKNDSFDVIRHSDHSAFSDAGNRYNTDNVYGAQDPENARRRNDYVNVTHGSERAREGAPRRENADEDRRGSSSVVVVDTGRQNPLGDARQSSDRPANARRKQSHDDVGRGSDDGARELRLSGAGDVTETDVDNVADNFPRRSPPLHTEI